MHTVRFSGAGGLGSVEMDDMNQLCPSAHWASMRGEIGINLLRWPAQEVECSFPGSFSVVDSRQLPVLAAHLT